MPIPCVTLTNSIHVYITSYRQPRGRPLRVRHVSLALCQPPGTASAVTGPTRLWSSTTCMPRQPPRVKATQAIFPWAIYQKIPDREAGHNTETQHALTHLYRPPFQSGIHTKLTSMGRTTAALVLPNPGLQSTKDEWHY